VIDSSKLTGQTLFHGCRGTFFASLSAMSLLTITSHHHLHHTHSTLTMHESAVVSRQTPSPPQLHLASFNHGTHGAMRDLIGNVPVRGKQRAISAENQRGNSKELDELRRDVVLLLLAWPRSVAVTVRVRRYLFGDARRLHSPLTELISSCLHRLVTSLSHFFRGQTFWVSERVSTQKISISGAISLIVGATKHAQFISFGIYPLGSQCT
jgi:DNA mismatch repair protein MLH3